jgi:hypothetical protein
MRHSLWGYVDKKLDWASSFSAASTASEGIVYPDSAAAWATALGLTTSCTNAWRWDTGGIAEPTLVAGSANFTNSSSSAGATAVTDDDMGACLNLDDNAGYRRWYAGTDLDVSATESFLFAAVFKLMSTPTGTDNWWSDNGSLRFRTDSNGYMNTTVGADTENLTFDHTSSTVVRTMIVRFDRNADEYEVHSDLGDSGAQPIAQGAMATGFVGFNIASQGMPPMRLAAIGLWIDNAGAEESTDGAGMVTSLRSYMNLP